MDFLYIWFLELENNPVLLKKVERKRCEDRDLHLPEDRAGEKADLRPHMRLIYYFSFFADVCSRRGQGNSQRGQFPI